ncbi:MAG: hypothetical protein LBH59_04055 [Planctomycetaceae bacterium]|nr:hypothetical protein [Planctomycetaceae bacterium]
MNSNIPKPVSSLNKRFAMLRLRCSALRILKRLQHILQKINYYNNILQ